MIDYGTKSLCTSTLIHSLKLLRKDRKRCSNLQPIRYNFLLWNTANFIIAILSSHMTRLFMRLWTKKIIPLNDEKKYNPNILLPWTVLDIYANTNLFGYYLYKDEYDDDVANNHLYFLGPLVKLYCTLTCSSARFMKICAV